MKSILRFIIRYHLPLLFVFFEMLAFSMLFNNSYFQRAKMLHFSKSVSGYFYKRLDSVREYFVLKEHNQRLSEENARLKNSLLSSYELKDVDFLEIKDSVYLQHYFHIPAKVINNSTNKQRNYITLNRGRTHGVEPEMAVICDDGIVGVVNSVTDNYSTVISLLHTRFRASAKFKKNDSYGSLYWEGLNYRKAVLRDIPHHVKLNVGDSIVTSSFSTIYPEGVLIGTIEDYKLEGGSFYSIGVSLSTDFKKLNYVNIVKDLLKEERINLEKSIEND